MKYYTLISLFPLKKIKKYKQKIRDVHVFEIKKKYKIAYLE